MSDSGDGVEGGEDGGLCGGGVRGNRRSFDCVRRGRRTTLRMTILKVVVVRCTCFVVRWGGSVAQDDSGFGWGNDDGVTEMVRRLNFPVTWRIL